MTALTQFAGKASESLFKQRERTQCEKTALNPTIYFTGQMTTSKTNRQQGQGTSARDNKLTQITGCEEWLPKDSQKYLVREVTKNRVN